jgi:uncharacterized protein (TIGR03067 family)
MKQTVISSAMSALIFLFTPAAQAQDADEVAKLRKEVERLQKENERLQKENERLQKENDLLKKGIKTPTDGAGGLKTAAKDLGPLQGTWTIDAMDWGGHSLPKNLMTGYRFVFDGSKLTWEGALGMMSRGGQVSAIGEAVYKGEFKIDPGQDPKQIDITMPINKKDRTLLGIYEMKGDTLKVCCVTLDNGRRPTEFVSKEDVRIGLIVLTRTKK